MRTGQPRVACVDGLPDVVEAASVTEIAPSLAPRHERTERWLADLLAEDDRTIGEPYGRLFLA